MHGVAILNDVLDELTPSRFPKLRNLDLRNADFDPGETCDFLVLAHSPILAQLDFLGINNLDLYPRDFGPDPLAVLADLAPRFAHLALSVAGDIDIYVEGGVDEEEFDRALAQFNLT